MKFPDFLEKEIVSDSVDEAIEVALKSFACTRAEIDIEILQVQTNGFLGFLFKKPAKVLVRLTDRAYIARCITQSLLDYVGISSAVRVLQTSSRIDLEILSEESALIIGKHGQTLDALQYTVISMTDRIVEDRKEILIDIDRYRERRLESLRRMAVRLSTQVKRSGKPLSTQLLPPDERKEFHQFLHGFDGIESRSVGQGYERKIVVSARKS